jgi:hypothetical protein
VHERITTKSVSSETWERIRHEFLMNRQSITWIAEQPWAPSKPTVLKAINQGMTVRTLQGVSEHKLPIKTLQPAVQSTLRASEGAARVLAVVQAAAAGDGQSAAEQAAQVLPAPPAKRRRPPALPPANEPAGHPTDSQDVSGVTPTTVLRELARFDGAATIAEETAMMRDGKATAYQTLMLAQTMVRDGQVLQAKISAYVQQMTVESPLDVLLGMKITGSITLAADRASRVVQRVLELERELLGDPKDALGATGAPGETFAMTEEEALAEARRCSHVLERYGVPFVVGARAELLVTATNGQDIREEQPHAFVPARDDSSDAPEERQKK